MAVQRITSFLAGCTLLFAGILERPVLADWDCTQHPGSGTWSCTDPAHPPSHPEDAPELQPDTTTIAVQAASSPSAAAATQTSAPASPTTATRNTNSLNTPSAGTMQPSATRAEPSAQTPATPPPGQTAISEAVSEAEASPQPEPPADDGYLANAPLDTSRLEQGLDWAYCGPAQDTTSGFRLAAPPASDKPIEMSADGAELYHLENRAVLRGNVRITRGEHRLEAAEASYDRDSGLAQARGDAYLEQPGLRLLGRSIEMDLVKRRGHAIDTHYRLIGMNARGTAQRAEILNNAQSHYDSITYTSCPTDSDAWLIEAEQLDIDRAKGEGIARHAKLRVAGIPVLYSPYLSFPLDGRRKSGLLIPSIGNSNKLGLDLTAPYYFNIAPNMDATLSPRFMGKRGFMLGGEFRYLTASEGGAFTGEIIPDDRQFSENKARGGFKFQQLGHFGPRWSSDVNFNLVSDDTYLEDFGRDLRITSSRNLEQRGDVRYRGDNWQLLARLQRFQTIDSNIASEDQPYARLPQLLFTYRPISFGPGVKLNFDVENVYFDHKHKVHGNRLAFRPSLSLPLRRSYGFLIPRATLNHASYWLTEQESGLPDNPSSTIPTLSLDGGLVFERQMNWLGRGSSQTLEPRLYYLYAPYRNQDDLPEFDSAELDFSFASLFRENRFTGRDRVGDANQLTLALTSRTIDDANGRELLRGSIGQIIYFQDRRVQLQGAQDEQGSSFLAGELAARMSEHWSSRASLFWDPHREKQQVRKTSVGVHYRGPRKELVNMAYRLNRSGTDADTHYEDTDLSFYWPINPQVQVLGRWLYSLQHDRTMEAFTGVQYGQCCWRVRAVVRNFVNSPDETSNLSFMLQFELTGLGAFGSDIDDFLETGVYGYEVE